MQAAIGQGNLAQAQRLLQSWIEREPRLDEPRIWLAKVYLSRGAMEDAETLLIGLQSTEALGLRGLVLEKTERYADAARVFEALARQEASSPQWWLHWAINLENSGRLTEARLLYQTYLEQFFSHNERLTAFATERYRALAE
ncbi:MAG: tetratricopeptide repeat protein [Saccharospirillum sp.]|uniref:tetratricopeptide repeat protein n=1 Tax=Saccharospirillum sp. TaxID=2033801 RepID=UPI0034A049C5